MSELKFEIIEDPSNSTLDFFEDRINEFNVARWEIKQKKPLAITIKDSSGTILAGAGARTFGFWLLIDNIWVSEKLRGQDLGSQILQNLESAARARGCRYSLLDTLNFQARPFYEKFGYRLAWTQNNYPENGCKYFMVKDL